MCHRYFGCVLVQLCALDAPPLFQCTKADNMLDTSDLYSLAYQWDTMKLDQIGKHFQEMNFQEWAAAIDLALWCLQGQSKRRPSSFEAVFSHRFFDPAGKLRYLQSTDEAWHDFVYRQAAALHEAIARNTSKEVQELFDLGSVHVEMVDASINTSTCYGVGDVVWHPVRYVFLFASVVVHRSPNASAMYISICGCRKRGMVTKVAHENQFHVTFANGIHDLQLHGASVSDSAPPGSPDCLWVCIR